MKEKIGIVKKVFIPEDNKDALNSKTIGFIVEINDKNIEIIQPINDEVSKILKNDYVFVNYKILNNINFYEIHKIGDGE